MRPTGWTPLLRGGPKKIGKACHPGAGGRHDRGVAAARLPNPDPRLAMTPNSTRLNVTALEARDCPASLASMIQSVVAYTVADAKQLVNDVATIEYYRPTVARQAITNDLIAL